MDFDWDFVSGTDDTTDGDTQMVDTVNNTTSQGAKRKFDDTSTSNHTPIVKYVKDSNGRQPAIPNTNHTTSNKVQVKRVLEPLPSIMSPFAVPFKSLDDCMILADFIQTDMTRKLAVYATSAHKKQIGHYSYDLCVGMKPMPYGRILTGCIKPWSLKDTLSAHDDLRHNHSNEIKIMSMRGPLNKFHVDSVISLTEIWSEYEFVASNALSYNFSYKGDEVIGTLLCKSQRDIQIYQCIYNHEHDNMYTTPILSELLAEDHSIYVVPNVWPMIGTNDAHLVLITVKTLVQVKYTLVDCITATTVYELIFQHNSEYLDHSLHYALNKDRQPVLYIFNSNKPQYAIVPMVSKSMDADQIVWISWTRMQASKQSNRLDRILNSSATREWNSSMDSLSAVQLATGHLGKTLKSILNCFPFGFRAVELIAPDIFVLHPRISNNMTAYVWAAKVDRIVNVLRNVNWNCTYKQCGLSKVMSVNVSDDSIFTNIFDTDTMKSGGEKKVVAAAGFYGGKQSVHIDDKVVINKEDSVHIRYMLKGVDYTFLREAYQSEIVLDSDQHPVIIPPETHTMRSPMANPSVMVMTHTPAYIKQVQNYLLASYERTIHATVIPVQLWHIIAQYLCYTCT